MGLKFSIPGFFWVGKFDMYFFGWLDLSRDFFGYSFNNDVALHCICFIKSVIQYSTKCPGVYPTRLQFIQLISHPSRLSSLEFPFAVVNS